VTKSIFILLINIIVVIVFLSLWGFYFAIRPIKIRSHLTPADYSIKFEPVSFQTQDNITLKGWFIPSKKPHAKTIILLHGYPADKGDILPSRLFLHDNYNLLFFDFRYLGESGGHYSTAGKDEVLDLLAALNYLETRGIHEAGVWGFSLGGAVALMAAAQSPKIKALVIESAYARLDWIADEHYKIPLLNYPLTYLTKWWAWLFLDYDIAKISPAFSASQINIPVLMMYSTQDNVIPFRHGELLQQSLQHNKHAQFIVTDTLLHGESIADYQKIVTTFFNNNL
jgi:pimeloyl-ACP methyl ester carboxylesterase